MLKLKDHLEDIYNLYTKENYNIKQISDLYNCYPQSVTNALKTKDPNITFTHNRGNVNYFNKIDSQNKAYLLGFIAADGCLTQLNKTGNPRFLLTITIHKKDIDLLYFLKKEIGCENPVYELKRDNLVRFTISSKQISSDLINLGIVPKKSLILKDITKNINSEFKESFLLGYFDGDGSIYSSNNKYYISIRGTKECLESYNKTLGLNVNILTYDSTYRWIIGNKEGILKFYNSLYIKNPPDFFLNRKYEKFISFIKDKCQDQTISSPS